MKQLRLRCPVLIMSAPSELHIDRSTIPGRVLLRATSSVNNRGSGPLELRAHRIGSHSIVIYQAIYDANGRAERLVRMGPKVDYCVRDLIRSLPSSSSPSTPVYPACSQNPNIQSDVLGTSVGWSDVYPYVYPEQWIDVTGLRGRFAYVQIADPENLLMESNHHKNVSETFVSLPSGRVLGHRVGVAAP
jgi:hypothetical protein